MDSLLKPRATLSLESKCSVSFCMWNIFWLADRPSSKMQQWTISKTNAYLNTANCCNILKYVLVSRPIVAFAFTWVMLKIVIIHCKLHIQILNNEQRVVKNLQNYFQWKCPQDWYLQWCSGFWQHFEIIGRLPLICSCTTTSMV